MIRMGFDERWVSLAMETVHSASYSVLINGEPKGFIKPNKRDQERRPTVLILVLAYYSAKLKLGNARIF